MNRVSSQKSMTILVISQKILLSVSEMYARDSSRNMSSGSCQDAPSLCTQKGGSASPTTSTASGAARELVPPKSLSFGVCGVLSRLSNLTPSGDCIAPRVSRELKSTRTREFIMLVTHSMATLHMLS